MPTLALPLFLGLVLAPPHDTAQEAARAAPALDGFRYVSGRIPAGRVHRYQKSNLDGSHATEIALYLADETHLESLKWHPDEDVATLVQAEMDWEVCSVRAFRTYTVEADGKRRLRAELVVNPERTAITGHLDTAEFSCALERFPWHSYDFDFASLNVALRFLTAPEGETELSIVDPTEVDGRPAVVVKGSVFLSYERRERHAGLDCRRYTIDGPGLEERGGTLWAAVEGEVFLAGFEIALPDEPGMASGRLLWRENATLTAPEWERFVVERGRAR